MKPLPSVGTLLADCEDAAEVNDTVGTMAEEAKVSAVENSSKGE